MVAVEVVQHGVRCQPVNAHRDALPAGVVVRPRDAFPRRHGDLHQVAQVQRRGRAVALRDPVPVAIVAYVGHQPQRGVGDDGQPVLRVEFLNVGLPRAAHFHVPRDHIPVLVVGVGIAIAQGLCGKGLTCRRITRQQREGSGKSHGVDKITCPKPVHGCSRPAICVATSGGTPYIASIKSSNLPGLPQIIWSTSQPSLRGPSLPITS